MKKMLLIIFLLLIPLKANIKAQVKNPLMICVADSKSILVPFAVFTDGKWSSPWPKSEYDEISKILPDSMYSSLGEIPEKWYKPFKEIPEEWHILKNDGYTGVVKVTRPALVFCHCFQRWALISDATKKTNVGTSGDFYQLSHKIHLAVSKKQITNGAKAIKIDSDKGKRILSLIKPAFKTSETGLYIPLAQDKREKIELKVTTLLQSRYVDKSTQIYFFEVQKEYPINDRKTLNFTTSTSLLQGWILQTATGDLSFLHKRHYYLSYPANGQKHPLGNIMIDGKMFWFIRNLGYESESYLVLEVSPSGIKELMSIYGGGC